jgi:predicted MPP superfamily phosphohydrolase
MVKKSILIGLLVILILSALNLYTYYAFFGDIKLLADYKKAFVIFMVFMTFCEILYFAIFRNIKVNRNVVIFLSSLVGVSFIFFSMAVTYDIVKWVVELFITNENHLKEIMYYVDLSFLIITFGYVVFGFIYGAKPPKIRNLRVKIKNLKNPMNIVHLSDLHVGKIIRNDFIEDVVKKTNSLNPDVVVITGDLVDLEVNEIKHYLYPLRGLKAKFGTFYVIGNHEYYHGAEEIVEFIKTLNIIVLENKSLVINNTFNLIGLNDLFGNIFGVLKPDIVKAYENVDKDLPNILLAHQPKQLRYIDDRFGVDLMLSGHTHGGQIFPFNLLVKLDQPYVGGFHIYKNKIPIFISKGTGCWGPPIRFLASSEIVKIDLI